MAFGKSFTGQQASIGPAGSGLFSRAMNQIPDVTYLSRDPVKATEIFCCIALYLHCVDHRVAAHSYIGQAVRMAQSHGLHTDMQSASVGDQLAQHGRLLWWTIYTLDRKLSSLMGIPNAIHHDDISAPAPQMSDTDIHSSALAINVKLSQLLGSISINILLPFDLEAAYSAAFVLVMASEVEAKHAMHEVSLAALWEVFDTMIMAGNLLASSRKAEVEELAYSLRRQFHTDMNDKNDNFSETIVANQANDGTFASQFGLPSPGGTFFEGWNPGEFFPDSRLSGLADSLTMDELHDLWVQ
ncbi:hypothetical protein ACHAO9_012507 [Fusarium lateritium]